MASVFYRLVLSFFSSKQLSSSFRFRHPLIRLRRRMRCENSTGPLLGLIFFFLSIVFSAVVVWCRRRKEIRRRRRRSGWGKWDETKRNCRCDDRKKKKRTRNGGVAVGWDVARNASSCRNGFVGLGAEGRKEVVHLVQ